MDRIVVNSKIGSDGVLHLHLPVVQADADREVQVTVEPAISAAVEKPPTMSAADLLHSGLVGIWADRADIGDGHEFARQLREQAQTARRDA